MCLRNSHLNTDATLARFIGISSPYGMDENLMETGLLNFNALDGAEAACLFQEGVGVDGGV